MTSTDKNQPTELFDPIKIGKVQVKNRIAFAPTGMGTAGPDGAVTDQTICHYTARAKGGAGLIIIEHSLCSFRHWKAGTPILSFHTPITMMWMKDLSDAIHANGAKTVVQLSLGLGRQTRSSVTGTEIVAPSPLPYVISEGSAPKRMRIYEGFRSETPRELPTEEVMELEKDFVRAALRIKNTGFDGIEIHGAHGYLLADFISPLANKREDIYGGSFEKRLTLPLNLIKKVREKAGDRFVIGFRISGAEHVDGGLTLEDNLKLLPVLEQAGLDYIHLSSGRQEAYKNMFPDEEGVILPEAEKIKEVVNIPVICPNIHSPSLAEKAVRENRVDIVSLSRGLIADPFWPEKVKTGNEKEIRRCVFCYTCLKSLRSGIGVRCSVNKEVGRERFLAKYQPFGS